MVRLFFLCCCFFSFSEANLDFVQSRANESSQFLLNAFQRLDQQVQISKEITLSTEDHYLGGNERKLLACYEDLSPEKFPLLITTAVLEDGFGDYIQLKNVIKLLSKLGLRDVQVLIYYASSHKEKILAHPLPKVQDFTYQFIEFQRSDKECILKNELGSYAIHPKDFSKAILMHPLFQECQRGDRELLVVAAFFSEAFGILKKEGHPIFLREITPFLKNGTLQDIFVLGWGPNQAIYVDEMLVKLKSLNKCQKRLLALKVLPERLLKIMCKGEPPSDSSLKKYFSTHTLHHAYFHRPESNLVFLQIILHGLETEKGQHDFYLKNLLPIYQHLLIDENQSTFLDRFKIGSIDFHFQDGSVKKITRGGFQKRLHLIETEFLSAPAYAALISLLSPPYVEGCTGDNSPQQALTLEHIPLIEHTASKDYPKKNEVERHYCQNSASLFQALAQLNPYPDHLSKIFYLNDLLMFTIRQKGEFSLQDEEVMLLTQMIGTLLKAKTYQNELNYFFQFITNERNLNPYISSILKRQCLLRKHPKELSVLERKYLEKLRVALPVKREAILKDFREDLLIKMR